MAPSIANNEQPVWVAKYWHYAVLDESEFDSLEEAARFLEAGDDAGTMAPDSIVAPDGTVFHDYRTGSPEDRAWTFDSDTR